MIRKETVIRGRFGILMSIGSQVIASLTPILLTVVIARSGSTAELGIFAITLALQAIFVGLIRGFTTDVFLFSAASYARASAQASLNRATSAVLILTVPLAVVTAVPLCFVNGRAFDLAFGLAILIVPTAAQEHLRMVLVANRRFVAGFVLDALALAVVASGSLVLSGKSEGAMPYLGLWMVGSTAFVVGALILLRVRLTPRLGLNWLKGERRDGSTFATDYAVTAGIAQMAVLVVSFFGGAAAAGSLRAAQTLITPVSILTRGSAGAISPVLVRKVAAGRQRDAARICAAFSGLCAGSAVMCSLWFVVPNHFVHVFLGDSADGALSVLVPAATALGTMGVAMGAGLYLRALGKVRVATRLKLACFPVSSVGMVFGAWTIGAAGAQYGLAAGESLRAALAWRAAANRLR